MRIVFTLAFAICLGFFYSATAQTTWNGSNGTSWTDPLNWSAGVPDAFDDVSIPNVTNKPVISTNGITGGFAKSVRVQTSAVLTINATGSLTINGFGTFGGVVSFIGFKNEGTVSNTGKLILGSTGSVGDAGIENRGTFNNNSGGEISIDRSNIFGLSNILGNFTNAGKITIGAVASVGQYGIYNQATFNNSGGEININDFTDIGLVNTVTLNNAGKITIGELWNFLKPLPNYSLKNEGIFNNNTGGQIYITGEALVYAIYNRLGTCTNVATITINFVENGLNNEATFNNNTNGKIEITNHNAQGLQNFSGTFNNSAAISIVNDAIGGGLYNYATFNNNTGGDIRIAIGVGDGLFSSGQFTNAASISIRGGDFGLRNGGGGEFKNQTGGNILIDYAADTDLKNDGTFTNAAAITIGSRISYSAYAGIWNSAIFNNNMGGEIRISNSQDMGIYNTSTFTNAAAVIITTRIGGRFGILNVATFNNSICSSLVNIVSNHILSNTGTFTNAGLIIENASGNSSISSNTGIVQNLNGGTFTIGSGNPAVTTPGELTACCPSGNTLFVNVSATGAKNGTSWLDAYTSLQSALNSTCPISQIWLAQGTYKPTTTTDRSISFPMKNNLAIYGGFNGTETLLSQRNWVTNVTTLSGDIGAAGSADNSYNVVKNFNNNLNSTAILDGFTITGGNANGGNIVPTSNLNCGGGMYNSQSSPRITNCIFTGNSAIGATSAGGGGMFNYNNASPSISKCSFIGNSATTGGGGLHNNYSCSPVITDCIFTSNTSSGFGGGINNYSSSNPTITNCRFTGNSAIGGGGLYNNYGAPILTNCLFSGNNGGGNGGAIFQDNASLTLINSSFSGNIATSGSGLKTSASLGVAPTNIVNSIFWGDGGTEIVTTNSGFGNAVTNVTYSIVQGGYTGTGNLNADPGFIIKPPPALGTSGNLRPNACSPALNAGNDASNSTTIDLDGLPRKFGIIDMGAYEYQSAKINPPALGPDVTVYKNCFGETTNLTGLFNTTGLTPSWNTPNPTAAPPGTYRLVVTNPGGCTDTAFANVILEVATWTGTISNDWNTAGNWNINKVPGTLTHVIVPGGTPNPCYVNTAGALAASIQVRNGGQVRTTSTRSVTVNGKCLVLPPN